MNIACAGGANHRSFISSGLFLAFTLLFVVGGITAIPDTASAASGVSCETPVIGEFTPYIYEGDLNSFDFTISAVQKHLPLSITIGGTPIDLSYASVWNAAPGTAGGSRETRVHVDVPFSGLHGVVQIQVSTLQITDGPPPTCPFTATFTIDLPTTPAQTTPIPETTVTPAPGPATEIPHSPDPGGEGSTVTEPTSTPSTSTPGINQEAGACTTYNPLVWGTAAVIVALVTLGILLFISAILSSTAYMTAALLAPPILFVGAWYWFETCRNHTWFPIIALIGAIVVLVGSAFPEFWDSQRERIRRIFGR